MTRNFAVTFDYLCPFARNASEGVVRGIKEGRDWAPRFIPFSLSQVHVEEGETDVWDRGLDDSVPSGVRALSWGLAVRDLHPESFLDFHVAAFAARHDSGSDINDPDVLAKVAVDVGLDAEQVAEEAASGGPLRTLAAEHTGAVEQWKVFGVPTFIDGDEAVFVRLMERGRVDDVERVLEMLSWSRLNEFKRTVVPR